MRPSILTALSKAINAYLKLDPESAGRLAALEDKVVAVKLRPSSFCFYCTFTPSGLQLLSDTSLSPDAIVTGTPLALASVALITSERHQFFADDVKIDGDAELGQQVITLFDELEIDWEEYLSHFIGDVPAYQTGKLFRKLKNITQQFTNSVTQNVSEYLHEEKEWLPAREALADFFADIDELRMAVDRAEAKIIRLNQIIQDNVTSIDEG
jgi:ubiquinone biosynthesis accessory factor UbiJ